VVAEPQIAQPLSITFDDRGRMWVLQYRQFPNPNGLTPVKVDNWLRTKYDKLPEPPPKGPKGHDRISIYEDTNGDGRSDSVKHFISDLNLASGMALGHGGVFVVQSPYLLFYADRNQDDVPDGDPEVLLTGFGMDDAHAFANSLTWGPDGWLYGAQGSTATAKIRGIGFQQGIWRYHPLTKKFELFAEGGGNTWGIDFDRHGNLFAGGNTVEPLVHHVQGAYYVKGFGKHGPLHNPHTYGYFQPVKHHGYAGDSLTGGFVLYQGGAFPERFNGHCIAPNTRHSAMRWSTIETRGSTFTTRAAGDFITSKDIWFRPVDSTVGPDGALYVADWYDYNISHSSPKNRSQWYQPSRDDGRVWRVAPPDTKPIPAGSFDLKSKSNEELVEMLSHKNDWYARQARRIFAERRDPSVVPHLKKLLASKDQRIALQGLWSIYVSGGFDDVLAVQTLKSDHEYVRAWTVRLLCDERKVSRYITTRLRGISFEFTETYSEVVRCQLACSAKRLPARQGLPIIEGLIRTSLGANDSQLLPLLLWWAIEDKAISDPWLVLDLFEYSSWEKEVVRKFLVGRLARRFIAEGTKDSFVACSQLLGRARTEKDVDLVLAGMVEACAGRRFQVDAEFLDRELSRLLKQRPVEANLIQLSVRMGGSIAPALKLIADATRHVNKRTAIIRTLGETQTAAAIDPLLKLAESDQSASIQASALSALGYFDDERIGVAVRGSLKGPSKARAIELLCSRPEWAGELLAAIDEKELAPKDVSVSQVRQLHLLFQDNEKLLARVTKIWGKVQAQTPLQKQGRISAVTQLLGRGRGDAARGLKLYEKSCGNCHKLHGKGTVIGPDLTGAERKDRVKLVQNIVDPSAEVRPQFISHIVETKSGRIITGLLAES
ncbi:MAG: c-type cytochrome, partial [Planctomycetes bacterium]|nr:c-type cytochrome [Planctomycetota bacterium]